MKEGVKCKLFLMSLSFPDPPIDNDFVNFVSGLGKSVLLQACQLPNCPLCLSWGDLISHNIENPTLVGKLVLRFICSGRIYWLCRGKLQSPNKVIFKAIWNNNAQLYVTLTFQLKSYLKLTLHWLKQRTKTAWENIYTPQIGNIIK